MKLLYNIGMACYRQLIALAAHFNDKARKLHEGQRQLFDHLQEGIDDRGGYIWIHASSLGEFEQGRPLIEALRRDRPACRILLTFFSPSGYEVRKGYDAVDFVSYLPIDTPTAARRFLDMVRPSVAIFVKYEFWSNYLHELQHRGTPTYIISSIFRPGQIFFRSYGGFFRNMLRCFTHLYVQDEASRSLLAGIGITNVTVAGDTRFDRVIEVRNQAREFPLIERFAQGGFTWVAGSTWPADEELLLQYIATHHGERLVIAPHEIHEKHLAWIESHLACPCVRYTHATEQSVQEAQVMIVDTFGMLSSIYRYGHYAYVGGGFGAGIHNILEAAVYDIPVIFGPNYGKFREARNMIAAGCAHSIDAYEPLHSLCEQWVAQPHDLADAGRRAHDYIAQQAGATGKIYNAIFGNDNDKQ